MAWRCSGRTNAELIHKLAENGLITSERVKQAMLKVDRAHFAPANPYHDSPQSIGHRATISAPHMHAAACESLLPYLKPGGRVLDIGSGSGYLTMVLAELVRPGGKVVGVEHISALMEMGKANVGKSERGMETMRDGGVEFVIGDGRKGWRDASVAGGREEEEQDRWDAVHVGAAAQEVHDELVKQLKAPARMFIPVVEEDGQAIYVVDKDEIGNVTKRREMDVRYVLLTDAPPSEAASR